MKEFPVRSNLHTHTSFSDGKNTPEEIVKTAIECGMEAIGFSEHSYTPIDTSYCMSIDGTAQYRAEIERLKSLYKDRIRILCGLELDCFGSPPDTVYDYLIGSVHYVPFHGEYCVVDLGADALMDAVNRHCDGDIYRFTAAYYETVAKVADVTGCDIVGHFDLIAKYNEGGRLFEENDPRYLRSATDALDVLLKKDVIFEVNTGAISRGYRKTPYPAPALLRYIAQKGGQVTLNADAHRKEHLTYGFENALHLVRAAGFGSILTMSKSGWVNRKI